MTASHECRICMNMAAKLLCSQNKSNPKIYNRSEECVLVGYSLTSKAYQCWNRQCKQIILSYSVVFIESQDATPSLPHPAPCDTPQTQLNVSADAESTGDNLTDKEDDINGVDTDLHGVRMWQPQSEVEGESPIHVNKDKDEGHYPHGASPAESNVHADSHVTIILTHTQSH